jgi:protein-disulfide isomerase
MKKTKKYDAVAEVRKIREKLSVKYWKRPDLLFRDLKAASEQYHQEAQARAAAAHK